MLCVFFEYHEKDHIPQNNVGLPYNKLVYKPHEYNTYKML